MEQIKNKINNAIIIFGIIAILLIVYLLIYLKPIEIKDYNTEAPELIAPSLSREEISEKYKKEIRSLYSEIEIKISSSSIDIEKTIDDLSKIKIKAMEARVPEEYRDLHLSLVMTIDSMKSALDNNDNELYKEGYTELFNLKNKTP